MSRSFTDRYGTELAAGGEASFPGCARLTVSKPCGVHLEASDFPALTGALYEGAGLPAPVILERPEVDLTADCSSVNIFTVTLEPNLRSVGRGGPVVAVLSEAGALTEPETGRACADCGADISKRHRKAERCAPCATRRSAGLSTCTRCLGPIAGAGAEVCPKCIVRDLGITYRQLDYWVRAGWLRPIGGQGTGTSRLWPESELEIGRRMGRLVAAGLEPKAAASFARGSWPRAEIAPGIWIEARDA